MIGSRDSKHRHSSKGSSPSSSEKSSPDWEQPSVDEAKSRKWSAADFIIPAADAKGHSERQWFRCQPGHDRMMDMLVASKKFPFRTRGDFVRWSVHMGLHVLERMEPNMPSVTRQVDLVLALVREDEFRAEMDDMYGKVSDRVAKLITDGKDGHAKTLVAQTKAAIDQMPEGPWREHYQDRFEKQFAIYLQGDKKRKGLMRGGEDEEEG